MSPRRCCPCASHPEKSCKLTRRAVELQSAEVRHSYFNRGGTWDFQWLIIIKEKQPKDEFLPKVWCRTIFWGKKSIKNLMTHFKFWCYIEQPTKHLLLWFCSHLQKPHRNFTISVYGHLKWDREKMEHWEKPRHNRVSMMIFLFF